jgi:D-alanine-D-alanine ligase-like ATP-grasp enzyme
MLPAKTVVLVNTDFESRASELTSDAPRGFEADAAVLDTARAVREAIESLGVEVEQLAIKSSLDGLADKLRRRGVSTVFNLVESIDNDYGREWQVPLLLSKQQIRYTGNGALPLRLCRAKDRARRVLMSAGVRVARGAVLPCAVRRLCFCFPRYVAASAARKRGASCQPAACGHPRAGAAARNRNHTTHAA